MARFNYSFCLDSICNGCRFRKVASGWDCSATAHRACFRGWCLWKGIISAMRFTAEGRQRELPRDPAIESIAVPLIRAMNLAVAEAYQIANKNNGSGHDQAQQLQNSNITLTLDKALHTTAQHSLKQ